MVLEKCLGRGFLISRDDEAAQFQVCDTQIWGYP